jgi:hypothetical protein
LLLREEADPCGRRGRRSLAAVAGKRPGRLSGRILGPDPTAKGSQGRGPSTAYRRASAPRPPPSAMTAPRRQPALMHHKALIRRFTTARARTTWHRMRAMSCTESGPLIAMAVEGTRCRGLVWSNRRPGRRGTDEAAETGAAGLRRLGPGRVARTGPCLNNYPDQVITMFRNGLADQGLWPKQGVSKR